MRNNRIAASFYRVRLSSEAKERMLSLLKETGENAEKTPAPGKAQRRWLVPVAILVSLLLLSTAVYAATVLIRKAEPYEIRHKVEGFEYRGVGARPKQYLESHVLPDGEKPVVAVYPEGELLRDNPPNINYMDSFANYSAVSIYYLLGYYPTPNVRKVESEKGFHYYVMYMTEKGARYYLFYDEHGMPYGYPVYLTEMREYRDFTGLKPGDPIEKVEKIDGTASVYRSYFRSFEEVQGNGYLEKNESLQDLNELYYSYPLAGVHYLADGLLEIRYEFDEDGKYVIRSLHYAPDYVGIVPDLELFAWPDLSLWSEEDREDVMRSYEESYQSLVDTDYSYVILPIDQPDGEKVIADIEANTPPRETQADEVEWVLPVYVMKDGTFEAHEYSKNDFTDGEMRTIIASRQRRGEPDGVVETIFAGGVSLSTLAEKAGLKDFRKITVTVENGEELVFTSEDLRKNDPVVAWIKNKEYAMDASETGLSLAVRGDDVKAFRFSVMKIVIE